MKRAAKFLLSGVLFFTIWTAFIFHDTVLPDLYLAPQIDQILPTVAPTDIDPIMVTSDIWKLFTC